MEQEQGGQRAGGFYGGRVHTSTSTSTSSEHACVPNTAGDHLLYVSTTYLCGSCSSYLTAGFN